MKKKKYFYDDDKIIFDYLQESLVKLKEEEIHGQRGSVPKMREIDNSAEYLYLLYKLRLYCRYITYGGFLNPEKLDVDDENFRLLEQHLEQQTDLVNQTPVLYAYRVTCNFLRQTHSSQPEEVLSQIIQMMKDFRASISSYDFVDLLSLLSNWCTKGINLGYPKFRASLFSLNVLITSELRKLDGRRYVMSVAFFKNIIVSAIACREEIDWSTIELEDVPRSNSPDDVFQWVDKFISTYGSFLKSPEKKAYIKFCKAYQLFWQNDIRKCYEELQAINTSKRDFINIDIKKLLLMTLYEAEKSALALPRTKKTLPLLTVEKTKDSYRHQLNYFEKEKSNIGYLIEYHKTFLLEFGKMYAFFKKHNGVYKSSQSAIAFNRKKQEVLKHMQTLPYPYMKWLAAKVVEIE